MVPAILIADGLHEGEVFSASFAQRAWQASLSSHDMPWAVVPAVPDSSNRLVTWHLEQVYVTAYVSGRCLRRATSGETLMEVRGGRCHLLHVAAKTSKRIQKSSFSVGKRIHIRVILCLSLFCLLVRVFLWLQFEQNGLWTS